MGRNDDGSEDSRRRFTVTRPNRFSREPTLEAAAILSNIQGNGYDKIYADDICKPEVAHQPAVRQQVNFKWKNEVEQRLRNPATSEKVMICTPWHEDDTHSQIKKQIQAGIRTGWRVESFSVRISDSNEPVSLWPARYTADYYKSQQARLSRQDYARLYEMRCMPDEARVVSRLHFYPSDRDDPLWDILSGELREAYEQRLETIRNAEQWLSIDPSATSGKFSTETAVNHSAITAQGVGYLVDCWFFPGNPVLMQKWIVCAIMGRIVYEDEALEGYPLPATKTIHRVLIEAQSGMKGQVVLWREFIIRELKEKGFRWNGYIEDMGTRGRSGMGQNVGKRIRLTNCAGYLENGLYRLPGRMEHNKNLNQIRFVCSSNERVKKLVGQILNFPSGLTDGVDTVTQFLIWNEARLHREQTKVATVEDGEIYDTMKEGMKFALASLRNPEPDDEMERESQWITDRFG